MMARGAQVLYQNIYQTILSHTLNDALVNMVRLFCESTKLSDILLCDALWWLWLWLWGAIMIMVIQCESTFIENEKEKQNTKTKPELHVLQKDYNGKGEGGLWANEIEFLIKV